MGPNGSTCALTAVRLTKAGLGCRFEGWVSNRLTGETVFESGEDLDLTAEARSDPPVPAAVPTPRWGCRTVPSRRGNTACTWQLSPTSTGQGRPGNFPESTSLSLAGIRDPPDTWDRSPTLGTWHRRKGGVGRGWVAARRSRTTGRQRLLGALVTPGMTVGMHRPAR